MITRIGTTLGLLAFAACAPEAATATEDVTGRDQLTLRCAEGVAVVLTKNTTGFDVAAPGLFQASGKMPALNVKVEDGASNVPNEYVDFNDAGLEAIPVPSPLTIDLAGSVRFQDAAANVALECAVDRAAVLGFLGLEPIALESWEARAEGAKAVAFDIDDTLAFTTPAFARGFATGGAPLPDDSVFWTAVNGCDSGCPAATLTLPDGTTKELAANVASGPKVKARALVAFHKAHGARVYAITARPDFNGAPLRAFIERELGIAAEDVFFEPDVDQPGNPKGKTDRIEGLGLDVFYGDSDSDITDAHHAFGDGATKQVAAVRFQRSPKSSNRKAGVLSKYHPGYFGEPILDGTYE